MQCISIADESLCYPLGVCIRLLPFLGTLSCYIICTHTYCCRCFHYILCPLLSRPDSSLHFETINLNTQANWYTDKPDGKDLPILSLLQLEKDTFFVGLEHKAMFVDRQGRLKPNSLQASELNFDKPSERMGECLLIFIPYIHY